MSIWYTFKGSHLSRYMIVNTTIYQVTSDVLYVSRRDKGWVIYPVTSDVLYVSRRDKGWVIYPVTSDVLYVSRRDKGWTIYPVTSDVLYVSRRDKGWTIYPVTSDVLYVSRRDKGWVIYPVTSDVLYVSRRDKGWNQVMSCMCLGEIRDGNYYNLFVLTIFVFNLIFVASSLLLGTKCVFKYQDLQMLALKLNKCQSFLPT